MAEIAIPAPAQSNSFGVHLLVNFKPIEDADQLLDDCKSYIDETQTELYLVPFAPAFSRLVTNVRQWRLKRKDSRLQTVYDSLLPKVLICEKELRTIIGDVVEKKGALRTQARHLQIRLNTCVSHNQDQLNDTDAPLEDTRTYVNILSDEQTYLKQMLTFNAEVNRLKASEANAKKQQALRWGGLSAKNKLQQANAAKMKKNGSSDGLADIKDEEHQAIEQKLKLCRTLRQSCVGLLAAILERRGMQQMNVDNCLWSLDALKAVVKREGLGPSSSQHSTMPPLADVDVVSNGEVPATEEDREVTTFDHSRCADCAYGYSMAGDCISHLAALQKQAQDANKRLQLLVEMRERMMEASELMKIQLYGGTTNTNSSNNNNNSNGVPNGSNNNSMSSRDSSSPDEAQDVDTISAATSATTVSLEKDS